MQGCKRCTKTLRLQIRVNHWGVHGHVPLCRIQESVSRTPIPQGGKYVQNIDLEHFSYILRPAAGLPIFALERANVPRT